MVLEEFDVDKNAIINPCDFRKRIDGIPKIAITCFERKLFGRMLECLEGEQIGVIKSANEEKPVYRTKYKEKEIVLYMSDVGAAGCANDLEDIYFMGVETVIMFGSCGVLDKTIEDCSVIIPDGAVRDEGTSYHYATPSDEIGVNLKYVPEFTALLTELKISYRTGKVWTTDAIYRETKAKMQRRKEQGCICVDMECSAVAAVAQFREKEIFQFFYAADNLDGEKWDKRSLSTNVKFSEKDKVAQLALELALRI